MADTSPTPHPHPSDYWMSSMNRLTQDAMDSIFINPDPPLHDQVPLQPDRDMPHGQRDALLILLPLLIVLSTMLFLLLLFLVCILVFRRRRGIVLADREGPTDVSREDLLEGDGGFEGVESRWLESVSEDERRTYRQAKDYQTQHPPNSLPTDITLSQFLSIQEKGVSAWCFEPDYETMPSVLVHARTELTFLPDPASSSSVQSNLPLPKLNEVYYWEAKMFDLPHGTNIAVGLTTKPYPVFSLPGKSKFSVAYHSNGDKMYNYPFTATPLGPSLKEGDVVGIGYRPRTGTVFFTRNGRKMEDAFVGLTRWNLFPTVGADGPCSLHINLGQSGFVFIEANVKKWGLAPTVGTLAPPPAYGSERGSILLATGDGVTSSDIAISPQSLATINIPSSSTSPSRRHRTRRVKPNPSSHPVQSSPLRGNPLTPPSTPPPPITPIEEDIEISEPQTRPSSSRYISPTDAPPSPPGAHLPRSPSTSSNGGDPQNEAGPSHSRASSHSATPSPPPFTSQFNTPRQQSPTLEVHAHSGTELTVQAHLIPPESPADFDPPTPNERDIHLRALSTSSSTSRNSGDDDSMLSPGFSRREPPAYSPLDAYAYPDGVQIDLPAEVIAAAIEGGGVPPTAVGQSSSHRTSRRRR